MELSRFGKRFGPGSGIVRLMDDLGRALASGEDVAMLGGGNPARIPEVERRLRAEMEALLGDGDRFERLVGHYEAPQGNGPFIEALAALLRQEYGWPVSPRNIALTNGSQTAFFFLFNLLGGTVDGGRRRILLPLTPEYIGYADVGLEDGLFVSRRPEIERLDEHTFKYHVDFDALPLGDDIGAICVSRPTNPTANVLSDEEIGRLHGLARRRGVPLIVDNAYGTPFPHIIFSKATPLWDEDVVLCMSLSKLGLPGARTGIVVARPEIVESLAAMNAVVSLAPCGFGAVLARRLVETGAILELGQGVILPFYRRKCDEALGWLREAMDGLPWAVHKPEGSFFFWLWLEDLPITSQELYERLKERGTLVVPGHYFFPGLDEPWRHRDECIRVNYAQDAATVRRGIETIAEEVRKAYGR